MVDITKDEMRERLGNIDQIRNLLFGHKIQEYEQRFEQCEQSLEKVAREISVFETETRDRLDQLQDSLTTELRSAVDSLDKKLTYISMRNHEQTHQLQKELQSTAQKSSQSLESLNKALNKTLTEQTNVLKNDLIQTRNKLEQDMESIQEQVFATIQEELFSLKDSKVSRVDLADILFQLCVKIKDKDNEFVPDFQATTDNSKTSEFLLPEQQAALESNQGNQ